jgi:hypothetical protein
VDQARARNQGVQSGRRGTHVEDERPPSRGGAYDRGVNATDSQDPGLRRVRDDLAYTVIVLGDFPGIWPEITNGRMV